MVVIFSDPNFPHNLDRCWPFASKADVVSLIEVQLSWLSAEISYPA